MYSRAMVIVLIAMLLGIAVPVTGVELKVNGGFGHPGDRVSVAVDLAEGTGVAIVSFDLFYDSGALVLEEAKRTGLGESFDLADTTLAPGKFGASHLSVDGLSESSGIITSLTFLIKEGVSGDTDLRLMNIEVKDKDGIPLETVSLDGKIEIQSRPVIPAPVASFTADPTRGEAPMTVAFADESSGEIESLTWDFGDGLTSTDTAPLHTYEEAGIFIATLTATGPGGSDTAAQAIDVVPAGAVVLFEEDFEVDVSSRWAIRDEDGDGQSWYLDAEAAHSGTSGIRSYYNAAGNNDWLVSSSIDLPASGKITLSFWAKSGDAKFLESFDVKLSTTGRDGLADFQTILGSVVDAPAEWREYQYDLSAHAGRSVYVAIQHVSVDEHRLMVDDFRVVGTDGQASASPPVASFVAVPLAGDAPLVVNFTDASSGEITSRSWDFGDGATSAETNPSHTYSGAGTYTATLTVTGPGGSATHTQEIVVSAVVVPAPVASFVAAPLTGEAPLTVQFTDASSGEITSRSWDFGDGATSAETSPSHTYETAGEYTVTLMVSGPGGSVAITQEIAVAAAAIPAPTASFTTSATGGEAPLTVSFADASSGEITSRSWDFGDGSSSAETSPSHTYSAAGTYTVTLTVTGSGGSATHTQSIEVTAPVLVLTAFFTSSAISGDAPLAVDFTDASSGEITSRSWDFGDGGSSAETDPAHTYTAAGTYTVALTVNGPGGSATHTQMIEVRLATIPAPVASFTASRLIGDAPLAVDFTDASSGEITSRQWDFGDGGSSKEASPSHTYDVAGSYTVTLTVSGPGGSATHAQKVVASTAGEPVPVLILNVEYFIDQDPGFGQGVSVPVSAGADIIADFAVDLSGVEEGVHTLYVRAMDAGGIWSLAQARPFFKQRVGGLDPRPHVAAMEYYIDQDPGFGQGVSVPVSTGADIIADFAVDLSGVEEGVHTLYVRAMDAGGIWSLAQARPFFKQRVGGLDPRPHIAAIDYFFIDKEDGTRTQTFTYADFTPAPDLEADFSMDLAGLDGEYDLFVYARDEKNARSFGLIKPVTVEFIAAAPQAQNDTVRTVPDAAITIDVLANDFDPDGTPLQVIALTPPENGTATIVGDTLVVYTPDSGFEGEDTFSYTILDGHADTATGTATIKIKQPNRAPEVSSAVVDFALSPGIDSFTRNLDEEPAVFSDADGDALIYAATSADEAIVRVEVEGTTLTGTFITSGSAQIVVTATDEEGASASTAFNVEGTPAGPVSMDFDLADGDQEQRQTGGAAAGKVYELQFNVGDAPEISGWSATIEYDPEQLRYVSGSFQPGSFIPGLLGLVEEKEGSAGVGGTVLGSDQKNSGEGTLGIASFEVLEGFKDSTDLIITQISFRRTDGQEDKRTVHAAATIASAVPLVGDFSGDEKVDFADFFLFADHFGQAAGDSGFDGLYDLDGSGQVDFADFFLFADYFGTEARGKLVSLARQLLGLPESARLEQNFPNPFNASTTIRFTIPQSARVDLTVYNLSGQAVARLVSDFLEAGGYTWRWDGRDASGRELASGMYLYRLQAGVEVETRKLLMLK